MVGLFVLVRQHLSNQVIYHIGVKIPCSGYILFQMKLVGLEINLLNVYWSI